jgi:hypothetical protein
MDQGATVQQGGGLGNGPKMRGGIEAGAHLRSDNASALKVELRRLGKLWWGSVTYVEGERGNEKGCPWRSQRTKNRGARQ